MTTVRQLPATVALLDSRMQIHGAAWVDGMALSGTTRCARQLILVGETTEISFTLSRDPHWSAPGVALGVVPQPAKKSRTRSLDHSAAGYGLADEAGIDLNAIEYGTFKCFLELTIAGEVVRAPLEVDATETAYHIACGSIFEVQAHGGTAQITRVSVTDALADGERAAVGSSVVAEVVGERLLISGGFAADPTSAGAEEAGVEESGAEESGSVARVAPDHGSCHVVLLSAWHCHGVELQTTLGADNGMVSFAARNPQGLPLVQVPAGNYHVVVVHLRASQPSNHHTSNDEGGHVSPVAAYQVAPVRIAVQPAFTALPLPPDPLEARPLVAMVGSGFAAQALAHPDESLQAQVENHFRIEVWGADIVSAGHGDESPRFAGGLTTDLVSLSPDVVVWDLFSVAALGAARGGGLDELLQVLGDLIDSIVAETGERAAMRHVVQAVRFAPQVDAHGERVLGQFGLVNDWNEAIEQLWVERLGAEVLSPAEVPLPPSTAWPPASEDIYVLPSLGSAVDLITELRRALGYRGDVLAVEPLGEPHAD